jgi:DNA-binding Xre family transcriptional regulator
MSRILTAGTTPLENYVSLKKYALATGVPPCLYRAGARIAGIAFPVVEGVEFLDPAVQPEVDRIADAYRESVPLIGADAGQYATLTFGQRLRELMARRGITQYRLAQRIGVRQARVSLWLSGTGTPGYDQMEVLCQVLDVPFFVLVGTHREEVEVEVEPSAPTGS